MPTDENPLVRSIERLAEIDAAQKRSWGWVGETGWVDLGTPAGRYRVNWQERSGDTYHTDVTARDFADAAWRVANQVYDTRGYPRQLLGITRLS